MLLCTLLSLVALAWAESKIHGDHVGSSMGPLTFLYPNPRPWSDDTDNTRPCGHAVVGDRTDMPLINPVLSMVIQNHARDVHFRIALADDPQRQDQFRELRPKTEWLDRGHQCFSLPDFARDTEENANATIQIEYRSIERDKHKPEDFFVCADVRLVASSTFEGNPPCFNVTEDSIVLSSERERSPLKENKKNAGPRLSNTFALLACGMLTALLMLM